MLTNSLAASAHLTITVSEIYSEIFVKSRILSHPLAFDATVRGNIVAVSAPPLGRKH